MTTKAIIGKKQPPKKEGNSLQLQLFSSFVSNNDNDYSNAIEVWEAIPKYFVTPKQMDEMRNNNGQADPIKWDFNYKDSAWTVKIQPAYVEQSDGKYKAFFPGVTEELVEEALKKILETSGSHDSDNLESWVKFSLNMLKRELEGFGRSRNLNKIKHAIEVMSGSVLTLYKENKEVWKGSILQDLVTIGREDYLANTSDAYHIARLPLFISQSINRLEYRQFNHKRLMGCDEQLSRWLFKRLVHRYRQANPDNNYHFRYSTVKQDSGLLQQGTEGRNRQKLISALEELKSGGVIRSYSVSPYKERQKIIDVKYLIWPADDFIKEQCAANKRAKDNYMEALRIGLPMGS